MNPKKSRTPVKIAAAVLATAALIIECQPRRFDGIGVLLECGDERAHAIVQIIRQRYQWDQIRFYQATRSTWKLLKHRRSHP